MPSLRQGHSRVHYGSTFVVLKEDVVPYANITAHTTNSVGARIILRPEAIAVALSRRTASYASIGDDVGVFRACPIAEGQRPQQYTDIECAQQGVCGRIINVLQH